MVNKLNWGSCKLNWRIWRRLKHIAREQHGKSATKWFTYPMPCWGHMCIRIRHSTLVPAEHQTMNLISYIHHFGRDRSIAGGTQDGFTGQEFIDPLSGMFRVIHRICRKSDGYKLSPSLWPSPNSSDTLPGKNRFASVSPECQGVLIQGPEPAVGDHPKEWSRPTGNGYHLKMTKPL